MILINFENFIIILILLLENDSENLKELWAWMLYFSSEFICKLEFKILLNNFILIFWNLSWKENIPQFKCIGYSYFCIWLLNLFLEFILYDLTILIIFKWNKPCILQKRIEILCDLLLFNSSHLLEGSTGLFKWLNLSNRFAFLFLVVFLDLVVKLFIHI